MTAPSGEVHYSEKDGVGHLTFDRPEARNAMTWEMYNQLMVACDRIEATAKSGATRVVTLRGSGGNFVAGTDITQFAQFEGADDGVAYQRRMEKIVERVEALPLPTVAIVEGYAVGGGLTLAAVSDVRICTPSAKFGLPIARTLGNFVSMVGIARLVSLIGVGRAKALVLTAEFLDAEQALRAGLVTEVVDPDALEARVDELCRRLIGNAPLTMLAMKRATQRLVTETLPNDEDLLRMCFGSADFREGVAAFTAKRKPVWQGR